MALNSWWHAFNIWSRSPFQTIPFTTAIAISWLFFCSGFFSIFILSYENLICECELAEVNATLRGKKTSVRFSSVQFTAIVKNRNNKTKWYRKISVKNEFWVKCKHYRCSLDEGVNIFIVVFAPQSVACAKKMRRETKKVTEGEECERKREKEKNERTNERTQQWHHTQKSHKNCVVKSSCLDTQ